MEQTWGFPRMAFAACSLFQESPQKVQRMAPIPLNVRNSDKLRRFEQTQAAKVSVLFQESSKKV